MSPELTKSTVQIVPPEAGRSLAAFGSVGHFKLEGTQTEGKLCLVLGETPPGAGPPPHVHRRDDEVFIFVEGDVSFLTEKGWVPLTPGTVVYVPRGVPHTFRNTGTKPSRHWAFTTPSGFEEFYARAAEIFAAGNRPDIQKLRAAATEYGYEILAPVNPSA